MRVLWHLEEDTEHGEETPQEDSRGSPTHGVSQMRKSDSRSTTPSAHMMTCLPSWRNANWGGTATSPNPRALQKNIPEYTLQCTRMQARRGARKKKMGRCHRMDQLETQQGDEKNGESWSSVVSLQPSGVIRWLLSMRDFFILFFDSVNVHLKNIAFVWPVLCEVGGYWWKCMCKSCKHTTSRYSCSLCFSSKVKRQYLIRTANVSGSLNRRQHSISGNWSPWSALMGI